MANDKVYTDYLMHGRTKGSRNGISTTKGYTAIGQKAKGRYINGRYVYDTPKSYGGNVENTQSGAVSKPYVSKEYLEELEYNSRKNNGSYDSSPAVRNTSNNVKPQSATNSQKPYVSKEYLEELEYNSRKNEYPKKPRPSAASKGARNNWQQQGNTFRAANEAWERYGSGKSKGITGTDQKGNYGGYGQHASLEGSTRAMNALSGLGKLRREKKNLSLYGSGDTKTRNSRSDIANAFADAKADAKNAFKAMKQKALLSIFNKSSIGVRKDKKKKKSWKDFFK